MRRSRPEQDPEPKQDLTPMIDIVFNLIIFFMIVSELSNLTVEELELAYADQAMKERGRADRVLQINVLDDGRVRVRGMTFSLQPGGEDPPLAEFLALEAEGYGREEATAAGGLPPSLMRVNLRVDRQAPFRHVQGAMDACQPGRIYKTSLAASPGDP